MVENTGSLALKGRRFETWEESPFRSCGGDHLLERALPPFVWGRRRGIARGANWALVSRSLLHRLGGWGSCSDGVLHFVPRSGGDSVTLRGNVTCGGSRAPSQAR